jgi:hypothetical protein
VASAQGACGEHAGAGSVALLPLLHGCPPVVARLNAADAACAVAGWVGRGCTKANAAHPSNLFEPPDRSNPVQKSHQLTEISSEMPKIRIQRIGTVYFYLRM